MTTSENNLNNQTSNMPPVVPEMQEPRLRNEVVRLTGAQLVISLVAQQKALDTFGGIDGVDKASSGAWVKERHQAWTPQEQALNTEIAAAISANNQKSERGRRDEAEIRREITNRAGEKWISDWSWGIAQDADIFPQGYDFTQDQIFTKLGFIPVDNTAEELTNFLSSNFFRNYCGEGGLKTLVEKLTGDISVNNPDEAGDYEEMNYMRNAIMTSKFLTSIFGNEDLRNACVTLTSELRFVDKVGLSPQARTQAIEGSQITSEPRGIFRVNENRMLSILTGEDDKQNESITAPPPPTPNVPPPEELTEETVAADAEDTEVTEAVKLTEEPNEDTTQDAPAPAEPTKSDIIPVTRGNLLEETVKILRENPLDIVRVSSTPDALLNFVKTFQLPYGMLMGNETKMQITPDGMILQGRFNIKKGPITVKAAEFLFNFKVENGKLMLLNNQINLTPAAKAFASQEEAEKTISDIAPRINEELSSQIDDYLTQNDIPRSFSGIELSGNQIVLDFTKNAPPAPEVDDHWYPPDYPGEINW